MQSTGSQRVGSVDVNYYEFITYLMAMVTSRGGRYVLGNYDKKTILVLSAMFYDFTGGIY